LKQKKICFFDLINNEDFIEHESRLYCYKSRSIAIFIELKLRCDKVFIVLLSVLSQKCFSWMKFVKKSTFLSFHFILFILVSFKCFPIFNAMIEKDTNYLLFFTNNILYLFFLRSHIQSIYFITFDIFYFHISYLKKQFFSDFSFVIFYRFSISHTDRISNSNTSRTVRVRGITFK
jgi:hypothetical protein